MFKSEWKNILSTPKGIAAILAIMVLPIVYTGLFLWAFWDPYSNLNALPVAIVNDDVAHSFEGETLHLGDDLVEKLIESETFHFEEVSSEQAQAGLNKGDYYLIIEIPQTFSEHATTLLDDTPQKLTINYIANEGQNFLGGQIGETAVNKIRDEVNEQVARTYAEQLFNAIVQLGDGVEEATNGAVELNDGALTVVNGATDLKGYLQQLASSTVTLAEGTLTLQDGAKKAADGAVSLVSGLTELMTGSSQLQDGVIDASTGAASLNDGVTTYTNGVSEVAAGYNTLQQKQQQFHDGVQTIAHSTTALQDGATQVVDGVAQVATGATDLSAGAAEASTRVAQLADGATNLQAGATNLAQGASGVAVGATDVTTGAVQVQDGLVALQQQIAQLEASLPPAQYGTLAATVEQLVAGSKAVAQGASQLQTGASTVAQGAQNVTDGATELAAGAAKAADGVNELATGASSLAEGAATVQTGAASLADGTARLATGAQELAANATQLTAGYTDAFNGLQQVVQNSNTLASGANDLAAGLATMSSKMGEFVNGVVSAKTGATDLTSGLTDLASGTTELVNGTNELTAKSGDLAQGGADLASGAAKLAEGTTTFSDELTTAKEEAGSINPTDNTYDMMASPVEVSKTVYNEVPNYGTGFAPYFISLGLAVGGLLIAQIYDYVKAYRRPTSGTAWFISKMSVLLLISLAQSAFVTIVVIAIGVDVEHPWLMFGLSMIASVAFISIVQMLVTWLGDVGKFMALVVLIIQLVTSAGTFPIELIPSALQKFYGALPMTYSVEAFRAVVSTGDMTVLANSAFIIALFTLPCIVLTYVYFIVKFKQLQKHEQTIGDTFVEA